jgi:hypothetical protein
LIDKDVGDISVGAGVVAYEQIVVLIDSGACKAHHTGLRACHDDEAAALGNDAHQHFGMLFPDLRPRFVFRNLFALVFLNGFNEADNRGKIGRPERFDPDHDCIASVLRAIDPHQLEFELDELEPGRAGVSDGARRSDIPTSSITSASA